MRIIANTQKPELSERPLIDKTQGKELVNLYKMLANETRLRLLHALVRVDEMPVTDLAREIDMTTQAVSNQLQRLLDSRIVTNRREGSRLFYRITDPCVPGLIDLGLCLLEETEYLERVQKKNVEGL